MMQMADEIEGGAILETRLDKSIMNRKWSRRVWEAARKYEGYMVHMAVNGESYDLKERVNTFRIYQSDAGMGLIVVSPGEKATAAALEIYRMFNPEAENAG
jgi:hypothetical protein